MSTRTKILAAVAVLAVLVILLSRGGEPSEDVNALEADPIASYVPPGGRLVEEDTQEAGTVLGRRVAASYTRLFALGGSGAAGALADAEAAAKRAGWTTKREGARAFGGEKRAASGQVTLVVVLVEDARLLPDDVAPPALSVSLRRPAA